MSTDAAPPPGPDDGALPFRNQGRIPGRSWWKREDEEIRDGDLPDEEPLPLGHPGAYTAAQVVADAVNTALLLRKPLLLTGRPGTGKTDLAERIAYELDIGPVLRFEAQSLSEANDLFYRFDYVAYMVAGKMAEVDAQHRGGPEHAINFVRFGPLGQAILRSAPKQFLTLPGQAAKAQAGPQRSVVLIDEIDKASRDFPNDLLNGIDRMSFELREVGRLAIRGAGRDTDVHPVVVITSNSERDLPDPFLRRCVYVDIPDPDREQLARIVRQRLFGHRPRPDIGEDGLPPLYSRLLDAFIALRGDPRLHYRIGTTELLNTAEAALRSREEGAIGPQTMRVLERTVSAFAKHSDDRALVLAELARRLGAAPAA